MEEQLRELFDNVSNMLNIVITPTQADATFKTTTREFFSYVKPAIFIENKQYDELDMVHHFKAGFKDETDIFLQGLGSFIIVEIVKLEDDVCLRVLPLDVSDFKLTQSYIGAFQYVSEMFFKKVEIDNYGMLQSAGISMQEHIEADNIQEVRDYLRKEFGVTAGKTIL